MQERCNSIANALELRFSCTNPSTYELSKVSVKWDSCPSTASIIDMDVSNKLTPTYQQPYSLIHIDHDWSVFRACIQVSQP